jgi:hypothetical protein
MMNKKLEKAIISNCEYSRDGAELLQKKLANMPENVLRFIPSFNARCDVMWWRSYFVERDKVKAKQYLYQRGLIHEFSPYKRRPMYRYSPELFAVLFSDNEGLYQRFLNWDYGYLGTIDIPGNELGGPIPMLHFVLRGEHDKAREEMHRFIRDDYRYKLKEIKDFFDPSFEGVIGIMDRDPGRPQKCLDHFLSPSIVRKVKRLRNIQGALYSLHDNILLKSARRLGFEYECDHPLVLNELLPIEPNESYDVPYYFVKEYKGEIPQSWLDYTKDNPVPKIAERG